MPNASDESHRPDAASLAEFLGLRRNIVALLVAIVVIGMGEEVWMRFAPKYLQALGAPHEPAAAGKADFGPREQILWRV